MAGACPEPQVTQHVCRLAHTQARALLLLHHSAGSRRRGACDMLQTQTILITIPSGMRIAAFKSLQKA